MEQICTCPSETYRALFEFDFKANAHFSRVSSCLGPSGQSSLLLPYRLLKVAAWWQAILLVLLWCAPAGGGQITLWAFRQHGHAYRCFKRTSYSKCHPILLNPEWPIRAKREAIFSMLYSSSAGQEAAPSLH